MKIIQRILIVAVFLSNAAFVSAQNHPDFTIKYQIKTTPVESQDRSGTCWDFATVSFLETEALRTNPLPFDLSEMYIVNYIYREKAQYYVRLHGKSNFGEGGQAHDVLNAVRKYGIVPKDIYPGLPKGAKTYDHTDLELSLKAVVDIAAAKEDFLPQNWSTSVESLLTGFFGEIPVEFSYNGKKYTPKTFINDALQIKPDDYVELTSYNHHPFYEPFDLEIPDNWSHAQYYNLPIDELMKVMDNALQNGYSVDWDGDVSESGFNHKAGRADLSSTDETELKTDGVQNYRQITFDNFTTTDDHLMHITGSATDKNGTVFYLTKNSWGAESNAYGGYLYMSSDYVKLKTIAFMVNKAALPADIAKRLGLK
jgi:bleomycin hydrolase